MSDDDPARLGVRVGALVYRPPTDAGQVVNAAIMLLRQRGVPVGGVCQRIGDRLPGQRASIWIDHLETGRSLRLDRPRGPGARDCVLDPDALAAAAIWLRETIGNRLPVIVVNRFGHTESEGGGMRAEIAEAVVSGAVLLIAVREGLLPDLTEFLGEAPHLLPETPDAIADWVEGACHPVPG